MASLLMAGGAVAQLQPNVGGELVALLPDGVTANIDQTKMFQTAKNLAVAGSPEKRVLCLLLRFGCRPR